jgi:outer membrane protein TolC
MGLAWQLGIEGAIPLWTFGKITSLWDAAEAQVELGVHELQREKNSIKLAVRRAYYGTQLARDAFALIGQATRRMDRYIERLERRVEEGEGDDIELLKLKMYRAELEARAIQARREESVALAGLRFLTGVSEGMDIVDAPLARARQTLGPIDRYLSAARLFRPEINMARAGVVAREAQVRLARARHYPDLALGLSAQWVQAPQVTDQRNPFVKDNANYLSLGAALVLRWKVDFLPQAARVSQAEADLEEVRATERFALGGVGVEVEEAFAEAAAAEKRMQAFGQALKFARQWLLKVQQGIDIGTFDDEDIVDPAKEYALKRFEHMNAIFDYNVALGKLELATGWDAVMVDE